MNEYETKHVATKEPFVFVSLFLLMENNCQNPTENNNFNQQLASPPVFFKENKDDTYQSFVQSVIITVPTNSRDSPLNPIRCLFSALESPALRRSGLTLSLSPHRKLQAAIFK